MKYKLNNRTVGDLEVRLLDPITGVDLGEIVDTTDMSYEKQFHFARLALMGDVSEYQEPTPVTDTKSKKGDS